jgi:hypothetical protein
MWIEILKREVKARGATRVASELGVSKSTVSSSAKRQVPREARRGSRSASEDLRDTGARHLPGPRGISPARCAETHAKARSIGMKASNPRDAPALQGVP